MFRSIITTVSLVICFNASAETRYVSDDVSIYMHSGPSKEYRIIGTINVGSTVITSKYDANTKFSRVTTGDGKTGWVNDNELQKTLPAKTMLPTVQKQLQEAQQKLKDLAEGNSGAVDEDKQSIIDKDNLIAELVSEKKTLQKKITTLEASNLELDLLQDTKDERIKMEWMMYGGSVLFFGLLLGLLIPLLPRRKKNRNNW
ncbi:MAG: TIGR04211 family SH3 domain-containing protein [Psychromonas sp.]